MQSVQKARYALGAATAGIAGLTQRKKVECQQQVAVPRQDQGCNPFCDPARPALDTAQVRAVEPIQRVWAPTEVKDTGCSFNTEVKASPYYDSKVLPDPDWRPLPTFSLKEVRDHGEQSPEEIWVTYRGGVYDMTTFLDCHPGGVGRIKMVQGQDLEAYWEVYELHHRPHIQNLIEHYRIGNLSEGDALKATKDSQFGSYFDNDPVRKGTAHDIRIPSKHPWNHEPARDALVQSFYTPNDLFFVRNHNAVPDVEEEDWELKIEENPACGMKAVSFTLNDLKTKFKRHEVVATLQCAGNRQEDFVTEDRPLYVAPHWTGGAIGCAKWAGVRVRDLLREAGLDVDKMALGEKEVPGAKICNFIGADEDECGTPYAGILPVEKVIDPWGDAILAYEMNGETLPRDHGYPIRLLAPGHAGCRNVKWVSNIVVSEAPSELDSGSKLDRHFDPSVSFMNHLRFGDDHVRLELGPVIQTMPITSIVCVPKKNTEVRVVKDKNGNDALDVRGVAYCGGGRGVCRVEVSIDDGKNFIACDLWGLKPKVGPEWGQGRNWCWVQWESKVALNDEIKKMMEKKGKANIELVCRAIDGDFNQQPQHMEQSYNSLGICINHWDRVPVTVVGDAKDTSDSE